MNSLYKIPSSSDTGVTVMCDTGELKVHKRTGKNSWFVCHKGQQINIKDIPEVDTTTYPVYFGYIFERLFQTKPNEHYDQLLQSQGRANGTGNAFSKAHSAIGDRRTAR